MAARAVIHLASLFVLEDRNLILLSLFLFLFLCQTMYTFLMAASSI